VGLCVRGLQAWLPAIPLRTVRRETLLAIANEVRSGRVRREMLLAIVKEVRSVHVRREMLLAIANVVCSVCLRKEGLALVFGLRRLRCL
jgi:hypothetical protein